MAMGERITKWRLPVGKAITLIRTTMGWRTGRLERETGIGVGRLRNLERGRTMPSLNDIDRIRVATGFDPYMLAYDLYYDESNLPEPIQRLHQALRAEWEHQLELMRHVRQRLPQDW